MVIRRCGRMLWWGTAIVIVGLAVTLSAARLLLPGMGEYQEQIIALVEDIINRKVEVGDMDAAWYRFSPVLRLQQVVIYDDAFPDGQLDVAELQVGLDVIDSLVRRKWRTSGIRIIGLQLALQTDLSATRTGSANTEALFHWLMHQNSVSLEQVTLDWQDPALAGQPVQFSGLSAQLRNDGWRHQLLIQTDINAYYGERVELAADLTGPLRSPQDWRGKVYLKTTGFHLSSIDGLSETFGYKAEGDVDLEVWARIRNSGIKWSAGSIDIARPRLSRRDEPAISYDAGALSSRFSLRSIDDGWNLELQEFSLLRDDVLVWPETRLRASVSSGEALTILGTISHVVVAETGRMLPLLPWVDRDMRNGIRQIQPRGELIDTAFELSLEVNASPGFSLRSRFDHLGMSAYGSLPGVTELSGSLEGNLRAGNIRVDSSGSSLHLPKVFSNVYDLSQLQGELRWERLSDRFRLSSEQLELVSGPLNARTRLQLDWLPDQSAPWLDMELSADDLPMVDIKHYLPDQVMRPKAMNWLRGAFRSGTAQNVRFLLQGPLDSVPFDQGDGRLEARFDFDDVLLDYHPQWGKLDALNGSALFAGRSMRITGSSATILDANVDRVVAVIDDFSKPVLEINGTVSGTLESLLAYIDFSPLRDRFGKLVDHITTSGDANLQLDLRVPLRAEFGKVEVAGDVGFQGNGIRASDSDIPLENVRGVLTFTGTGVTARDVSARLLEHPVKVSIYPQGSAETRRTVVDIEGNLELMRLLEKKSPHIAPYVNGAAYWHALLQIPASKDVAGRSVTLELRSDLKGVALDLPAPFSKAADDASPVVVSWTPGKLSSKPLSIEFDNGVMFQALMGASGNSLRKAGIHFGAGAAGLPSSDSIHLGGQIELLNLDAWISLLRDIDKRKVPATAPPLSVSTDLRIRRVTLLGYQVQGLSVSSHADDPWRFLLDGQDMSGQGSWAPAVGNAVPALTLQLKRLTATKVQEKAAAGERVVLTPERLPNLNLDVGEVELGPYELGKVVVRGERVAGGMMFPGLQVDSRAIAFNGEGAWLLHDGKQSTRFRADITGGELGELVKLFGDHGSIQEGRMLGRASLDWSGNPADFRLATVEGEISIETGKGRLAEIKDGAGKLLSLFNLNSLQRRLSLDFTDLTKEGFSFDKIQGTFVIGDGNAYTENFVIHGTSAIIEISGRTGLANRDYDQLVKVTPQVSSSLPLAGALAGGPAVGAAVFLAERLVGKNFNRMAQVRYEVSGTWDDPVYTRLKADPEPRQEPTEDTP